jgi:hypothetical protein
MIHNVSIFLQDYFWKENKIKKKMTTYQPHKQTETTNRNNNNDKKSNTYNENNI